MIAQINFPTSSQQSENSLLVTNLTHINLHTEGQTPKGIYNDKHGAENIFLKISVIKMCNSKVATALLARFMSFFPQLITDK